MQLDIFSDTICPWCYVGKRRLEQALAGRPQPDLQVTWRAFQLNPEMPRDGMERHTYLDLKFGGPLNAKAVYDQVRAAGDTVGIPFDFEAIGRTPNTIDSHRLIRFAAHAGRQDEMVQSLFDGYFVNGRDIGDPDTLLSLAERSGLDEAQVRGFLESDAQVAEVKAEDRLARRIGITGVPCFIFNGRHALSGAQPPEAFHQLFDVMREEESAEA